MVEKYPWHPMTNPQDIKYLGNLARKLQEAAIACNGCMVQGLEEADPVSGRPNREWLEDSLADVLANIELNIKHFSLKEKLIEIKKNRKIQHLLSWHLLEEKIKPTSISRQPNEPTS